MDPSIASGRPPEIDVKATRSAPQMVLPRLEDHARVWQVALAVLGAVTAVRLWILPSIDLMPQSTYYAFYAAHPSLSYFDHPPMVAVMIGAMTWLLGPTAIAVRLSAFFTAVLTQLVFLDLARQVLPPGRRATAWTLFISAPIVTVLGLMANPDAPLVLFWMLSLTTLARAIFRARPDGGGKIWWLVAGAMMGLAFDSKYPAVFLQLGMMLFLVLSRRHRAWLRTPWPFLALLVTHVVMLPVYIWNLRNGLASFSFQSLDRTHELEGLALKNIVGFFAVQSFLVQQVMFGLLLVLGWRFGRRLLRGRVVSARVLFVLCFFLPMVVVHIGLTAVMWVKLNWVVPAWLTGILLAAIAVPRAKLRRHLIASGVVHAALVITLVFWPVPITGDDTWFGWKELGQRVDQLADTYPETFVFSADSYKLTSEIMFYAERKIYARNVLGLRAFHFDFVDDPRTLAGRNALLIRSEPKLRHSQRTADVLARAEAFFPGGIEEMEPIAIQHAGKTVRLFRVFLCRDYRPLEGEALRALGRGW